MQIWSCESGHIKIAPIPINPLLPINGVDEFNSPFFENNQNCYQIMINGKRVKNAEVSRWIVEKYLKYLYQSCYIKVEHEVSIPIGFGLGSSGAAALSLSYALNDALDLRFTSERAAQIAHNAEIACNTGLGTVIAEFRGGFEIRTGIGGPGIGTIEKIRLDDYKAVVLCIEPIYTKSFLNDSFSKSITGLARAMLSKLLVSRCVDDFLNISYDFANRIHLTEGKCKAPLKHLISRNIARVRFRVPERQRALRPIPARSGGR